MARVFITGSADGLGLLSARQLVAQGHAVTLHARSAARGEDARRGCPGAEAVVVGDLSTLAGMNAVANSANAGGRFDAVIHNAGIGYMVGERLETADGLEQHFAINVLAPYVLTARITRPSRLVYLSSGMHLGGKADLSDPQWKDRRWSGSQAYSDTKLFDTLLAFAVARLWPDVRSNAVEPGWVATKMGGKNAPDDLEAGGITQGWLATSDDPAALVTGQLLYHQRPGKVHPAANDPEVQDALLAYCASVSDVRLSPSG